MCKPKALHEHAIFPCCLRELIVQVSEYANTVVMVEPEQVEALFELLPTHVEEWEPFEGDIVRP